ncbi:MAG: sigma-70 family RNA polymerase sigma factor, partial [Actinomycetota bacterium]
MTSSNGGASAAERFRATYDAYAADVGAYALRRLPAEDAADVVAETFVVVWRRIDELPDEPGTRAWLLGVARRVAADQTRGQQRDERLAERLAEQFRERFGDLPPIERLEQLSLVGAAIKRLSDDDRELLLHAAWDELQPAEIGT